jgi:DNA-binding PadR family transcriptional regulator
MGSRFFRHGELHLVVLALLEHRPMHGYELMAELTRLFGPTYRPSAGSIYPAVESMEAEGLIVGQPSGERRVYELTDAGRTALATREPTLVDLEVRTGTRVRNGTTLASALSRFTRRVEVVAHRLDPTAAEALLDRTADQLEELAATTKETT